MNPREGVVNLALILLSLSLVFAGVDGVICVSVANPAWAGHEVCQGLSDIRRFHPDYGWVEYPNQ